MCEIFEAMLRSQHHAQEGNRNVMTLFMKQTRLVSPMWGVAATLSVLLLGACAKDADRHDPGTSSQDVFTAPDGTVTQSTVQESALEDESSEKAGCTHIRFCDQPNSPNVIVCDTNDSTSGSCSDPATRCFECCSDARAVCGTANPITFDPGFPGTCSCG